MAGTADDAIAKKKRELLRDLEKLRREASKAEKECRLHAFHRKEDLEALETDAKRLAGDRDKELQRLSSQLSATKLNVRKFKDCVKTRKTTPAFLNDLKTKMVDIESSISSFKSKQKSVYDELIGDELQCFNEIASLEKKMTSWEQRTLPASARSRPSAAAAKAFNVAADDAADQPPAVAAFEKFQRQTGGHCGGWNEDDHAVFLRARQKHRAKRPEFVEEALPLLAPRSAEDVEAHEVWFQEFSRLLEEKRNAIEEWKKRKTLKRKEECDSYRETEEKEKEEERRRVAARRKDEERDKLKREAELAAWKLQKEIDKARAQEDRLKRELETERKKEAEKLRHVESKAKAEEFARAREEARRAAVEAEQRRESEERRLRRKTAAEEILKFQERDQMSVAQRLVFNRAREEEAREREERLNRLKEPVAAERDPNRLVKPTRVQEERVRSREEEAKERAAGIRNRANFNIRQVAHRATPAWRAGV